MSSFTDSAMADVAYGYSTIMSYPNTYKDVTKQQVGENDVNRIPTYSVSNSGQPDNMATMPNLGIGHGSIGHQNPLFWLLLILLVITGYIGFAFDFDFKKIGEAKVGFGNKK